MHSDTTRTMDAPDPSFQSLSSSDSSSSPSSPQNLSSSFPSSSSKYSIESNSIIEIRRKHSQRSMHGSSSNELEEVESSSLFSEISASSQRSCMSRGSEEDEVETVRAGVNSQKSSLDWRMDPSISLSDWRLQILNQSTKAVQTYHVHRVVMAVGPRACVYFQSVFSESSGGSKSIDATRVPLIAKACELIPLFLDFLYDAPCFQITTDKAVGLAYLASFFQQSKLQQEVETFIEQDLLNTETLHSYYMDSVYYDQWQILERLMKVLALELPSLPYSTYSALLEDFSVEYFLQVLELAADSSTSLTTDDSTVGTVPTSVSWSALVAEFCLVHQPMTSQAFEKLTNRLTEMDANTALTLLQLELVIREEEEEEEGALNKNAQERNSDDGSLENKCLEVLAEQWETVCEMDQGLVSFLFVSLAASKSPFLLQWFQASMQKAHAQLKSTREDFEASAVREATLIKDFETILEERNQALQEAKNLRNHFEATKTDMKEQISGCVRKNENEALERYAEEEKWNQERRLWKIERKRWEKEQMELERQLVAARKEVARLKAKESHGIPVKEYHVPVKEYHKISVAIPVCVDTDCPCVSEDENESPTSVIADRRTMEV